MEDGGKKVRRNTVEIHGVKRLARGSMLKL